MIVYYRSLILVSFFWLVWSVSHFFIPTDGWARETLLPCHPYLKGVGQRRGWPHFRLFLWEISVIFSVCCLCHILAAQLRYFLLLKESHTTTFQSSLKHLPQFTPYKKALQIKVIMGNETCDVENYQDKLTNLWLLWQLQCLWVNPAQSVAKHMTLSFCTDLYKNKPSDSIKRILLHLSVRWLCCESWNAGFGKLVALIILPYLFLDLLLL